jgi:hypothetical protein
MGSKTNLSSTFWALKYQNSNRFPDKRYLSPFEALGVSHSHLMELRDDDPDTSHAFQQIFNGALLFILGHEIGHLVPQAQPQMDQKEREAAADFFAFAILARSQFNPGGVALLFSFLGNSVDNVADFPNAEAYLKSLQTEPHPLSAARLMIVGTQLINDPGRFAPDSSREVTELIELTGKKIVELATNLNDLTARKQLRDVAAEIVISDLAIHKKIEHPTFSPFTR